MLPLLVAVLLTAEDAPVEVPLAPAELPVLPPNKPPPQPIDEPPPDDPNPHFVPVQGSLAGIGMLSPRVQTTVGGTAYVGFAVGWPGIEHPLVATHEGFFAGAGVQGFLGNTDLVDCTTVRRCGFRMYGGPAARVGYAFWDRPEKGAVPRWMWPDTQVYVQLSGFAGRESLPSQPLSPGVSAVFYGGRADVGVTSPAISRGLFWLVGDFLGNIRGAKAIALGVVLFPLFLLEHFELNFELSNPALSPGGFRFGLSAGTGF